MGACAGGPAMVRSRRIRGTRLARALLVALAAGLSAPALITPAAAETYRGYEAPPHSVIYTEGEIELRDYAPHLSAEVTVRGDRGAAIQRGFRLLAGYIFGDNAAPDGGSEKIDMTVPVTQAETGEGWVIRFMMPGARSLESLPAPENPAIRLVPQPAERLLVIRFSGLVTSPKLADMEATLRAHAAARGLTLEGPPRYLFYDDPFTLPWRRRNELALAVAG